MFKGLKALWTLCVLTAAGTTIAHAQSVVRTHDGGLAHDLFGTTVAPAGDVDNDGVQDYMVGAAEDGAVFMEREGYAQVFSGATGTLIHTQNGTQITERFGTAVTRVGDTNPGADDNDDYAVGAHYSSGGGIVRGKVWLYSGATGTERWSVSGADDEDELGFSLSGGYDVNGDGIPDLIAGAPRSDFGAGSAGYAVVLSGADGSELYRKDGSTSNGRVGLAVCLMGDLNPAQDTRADFAIGSLQDGVKVYSGSNGALLYALNGLAGTDNYGVSLARMGDVTGDGIPELIVGATQGNFLFPGNGYAEVRNGANGALVHRKTGAVEGNQFGHRVSSAGDWDADGFDDFMVADRPQDSQTPVVVQIFSGVSGNLLTTLTSTLSAREGSDLASVGDTDGDGRFEIILGAEFASPNGLHSGKAVVYESPNEISTGCVGGSEDFCSSLPNSTGQTATLVLVGSTSVADNDVVLVSNRLPTNQPGVFYYGDGTLDMPFGNGVRCVGGGATTRLGAVNTGPAGLAAIALDLDAIQDPQVMINGGSTWYFQFWYRDPNAGDVNFSNGMRVDFCD